MSPINNLNFCLTFVLLLKKNISIIYVIPRRFTLYAGSEKLAVIHKGRSSVALSISSQSTSVILTYSYVASIFVYLEYFE